MGSTFKLEGSGGDAVQPVREPPLVLRVGVMDTDWPVVPVSDPEKLKTGRPGMMEMDRVAVVCPTEFVAVIVGDP